jgi:hypothetical protein
MSALSIFASIAKYFSLAAQAVQIVQTEIGPSSGNPAMQQGKLAAAVAIVLAAAHAGESVPVAVVQRIASVVEIAVSVGNALGLFGKTKSTAPVSVPPPTPPVTPATT